MGTLIQTAFAGLSRVGSSIGESVSNAGMGGAGAQQNSMGLDVLKTGLETASNVFGGIGQMKAAQYQGMVARRNAQLAAKDAESANLAGLNAEQISRLQTGRFIAEQKTAQASNGIDVNTGSAVAVRDSAQVLGEMDAQAIRYNAARQVYGYNMDAANYTAEAKMDDRTGRSALLKGLVGGAESLLSGAASLGDKWQTYKQSGALTPASVSSGGYAPRKSRGVVEPSF